MSFESWKSEFYPVDAKSEERVGSDASLVEHSLLKWRGALPGNVKKHGLEYNEWRIFDEDGKEAFEYFGETCALCLRYVVMTAGVCDGCPLFAALGLPCDVPPRGSKSSVYGQSGNDPAPMIAALEKALLMVTTGEGQG